MDTGR